MRRAQVLFEHPILFGMFAGSALSLAFYAYRTPLRPLGATLRSLLMFLTAFFSLSTGAIVTVAVQYIHIVWDFMTRKLRRRWLILAGLFLFLYVLIDSLSNRNPFEVFVSYLTFSTGSSYNRILIWHFGTAQVWNTPWFGIGLTGDWERPRWMGASMDNFWLLTAVRYGFPAFLFLAMSVLTLLKRAGARQYERESTAECRAGIIISIVGLIVGACTVHLWNNAYAYFLFMVGSVAWLTNEGTGPKDKPKEETKKGSGRKAPTIQGPRTAATPAGKVS
jgi:O-antigen ligase